MPLALAVIHKSPAQFAAASIAAGALFFTGCADHHDYYPTRHRTVTHHRDVVHDEGYDAPSYSGRGGYREDTSHDDGGDY